MDISYRDSLSVQVVLVALHGVSLSRSGLPVRKEGGVIALNHLFHQVVHSTFGKQLSLIDLLVHHDVESGILILVGPLVIRTRNTYGCGVCHLLDQFLFAVYLQGVEGVTDVLLVFEGRADSDRYADVVIMIQLLLFHETTIFNKQVAI